MLKHSAQFNLVLQHIESDIDGDLTVDKLSGCSMFVKVSFSSFIQCPYGDQCF